MKKKFSLYIHWPFCKAKCSYCDFNSHVSSKPVDETNWQNALISEMKYFARETMDGRTLKSIFFGGGTPSIMSPEITSALINAARSIWPSSEDMEISLEANPTSIDKKKFKGFSSAGINRLSLGIQSLSDDTLKFLGREHSAREAMQVLELAREIFEKISFDIIYSLPQQTTKNWTLELKQAIELAGGHLSLYQLSIEKGTDLYKKEVTKLDQETSAHLYETTCELTSLAGYDHYEISNFAQTGNECIHNLSIWRGGDYVGIGPGAHGRITNDKGTHAIYQIYKPDRWLEQVKNTGHATAKRVILSKNERAEEMIMTGLRLNEGIKEQKFINFLNVPALTRLKKHEYLKTKKGFIKTTKKGQLCLNSVLYELLG